MAIKRKPPSGNVRRVAVKGQNNRGLFTNKASRLVQFENWQEHTLMLQLDRRPDVRDFGSQPENFMYVDSIGQRRSSVPDFIAWRWDNAVELHIVRSSDGPRSEIAREREEVIQSACQERRWIYVVHTPQSLPQGTARANLRLLVQYRPSVYADNRVTEASSALLAQRQPASLQETTAMLARTLDLPKPQVVAALCHLIWHGAIETDFQKLLLIDGAINPKVVVWRKEV
jgi:hypothetical protein